MPDAPDANKESIASRLTELVEKLADRLGIAADEIRPTLTRVYDVFLRQSRIEGLMFAIGGFVSIGLGSFLISMISRAKTHDGACFYGVVSVIFIVMGLLVCGLGVVTPLLNPHYRAIEKLEYFITSILFGKNRS